MWYRLHGYPAIPFDAKTLRMFEVGHAVEAAEAEAIAAGLVHDGWKLERNVLVWVSLAEHLPVIQEQWPDDAPAFTVPDVADEKTGLIGGRLDLWWSENDTVKRDGAIEAIPRTSRVPRPMLVGHVDAVLTKAWVNHVIEVKSKGILAKKDIAEPRFDYVLQSRSYGFSLGGRYCSTHQIGRDNGENAVHNFTIDADFKLELSQRVRALLEESAYPAPPMPRPPQTWSCGTDKTGKPYCKFRQCPQNPWHDTDALSEEDD